MRLQQTGSKFAWCEPCFFPFVFQVTVEDPGLLKALHNTDPACAEDPEIRIPLFGAQYKFHLEGVVDCPEFLVHFQTLEKLAEKYGLILIARRR